MNLLQDIITYIRRIIKSASDSVITDALIIDYINRFWIIDVDARMQLFDLKTSYRFQTSPGVDQYNMPLYDIQSETPGNPNAPDISMYPVYQGFLSPAFINGIQVPLQSDRNSFFNIWPNIVQNLTVVGIGNGTSGPYTLNFPIIPNFFPPLNPPVQALLRGHVDITGIISTGSNIDPPISNTINFKIPITSIYPAVYITSVDGTGANVVVQDSGQFLTGNVNYGLLMEPGPAPFGYSALGGGYSILLNTVNYFTGQTTLNFNQAIPVGADISAQCFYLQCGLPRSIMYHNNVITLRSPPDTQYLVELDAYLSPSAFFNTSQSIPFAYMSEYIARGAARKILSDTGDVDQFNFYEPLFKEQEILVWKRSQRQFTSNRTPTIYSQGINQGQSGYNNVGGSTI
jgi:hypothetical protein